MEKVEVYADKRIIFILFLFVFLMVITGVMRFPEVTTSTQIFLAFCLPICVIVLVFFIYLLATKKPILVLNRKGVTDNSLPFWTISFFWDEIEDVVYTAGWWRRPSQMHVVLRGREALFNRLTKWERRKLIKMSDGDSALYYIAPFGKPLSNKRFAKFLNDYRLAVFNGEPTVTAPWFPHVPEIKGLLVISSGIGVVAAP